MCNNPRPTQRWAYKLYISTQSDSPQEPSRYGGPMISISPASAAHPEQCHRAASTFASCASFSQASLSVLALPRTSQPSSAQHAANAHPRPPAASAVAVFFSVLTWAKYSARRMRMRGADPAILLIASTVCRIRATTLSKSEAKCKAWCARVLASDGGCGASGGGSGGAPMPRPQDTASWQDVSEAGDSCLTPSFNCLSSSCFN
jgi:hypothetical protein